MSEVILYLFFRAFCFVTGILPLGFALWAGRIMGALVCLLPVKRKRLVFYNIRNAYKAELDEAGVNHMLRRMYQHFGMSLIEYARLHRMDKEYVDKYITFEGLGNLDNALKNGGTVALMAHHGNWEMLLIALALKGYPLNIVVRPIDNTHINHYVTRLRTRAGNKIIEKKGALRKMLRVLEDGKILSILLDQRAAVKEGVECEFFGRKAMTSKGLAGIALKTDATVVPVSISRMNGPYHKVVCDKAVSFTPSGNKEEDVAEMTQIFTSSIENFIRRNPEQWFWFHSRWVRRKNAG
ncbi:MAG: lysophospholipid acyltransferase family protein [Deltaproteobacteria bacterium]|nr:lysophospholipid acyltransferase family protein [Deltaproteobacteria bacterium]